MAWGHWFEMGKGIRMMQARNSSRVGAMVLVMVLFLGAGGRAATYEVGQRWVYRHEGPRPGSIDPNTIDGQRIILVISAEQKEGVNHWVLQERYTADTGVVGRLQVSDAEGLMGFEIESEESEVAQMTYDTPMPYPVAQLDVGQETTFENVLRMHSPEFAMPIKVVTKRMEDETITTPAGEFLNCQHYRTTTQSTINVKVAKVPVSEWRDRWYHESVNGLVKEVYQKDAVKFLAWSQAGYTATSTLEAFDTQEIEPEADPAGQSQRDDPPALAGEDAPPLAAPSASGTEGFALWVPVAVAAVFAAAILILIKRPRRG